LGQAEQKFRPQADDEIIKGCLVTAGGKIVNEKLGGKMTRAGND